MLARPRSRQIALALFGAALIFAVVMALLPKPPQMLGEMRDKYQHMLAFATLAGLAAIAFPRMSLWLIGERLSFLGALIEVFQSIPALHRDCDPVDWVADTAAIAAVLSLVKLLKIRE